MVINVASNPEIVAAQIADDRNWHAKAISKLGDAEVSLPYLIIMRSSMINHDIIVFLMPK